MSKLSKNKFVGLNILETRSFSGADVATRPHQPDNAWWPKGPLVSGVKAFIDDAVSVIHAGKVSKLYFLVGGAGNGKSFAVRDLCDALGVKFNTPNRRAARKLKKKIGKCHLTLINDATIAFSDVYGTDQDKALAMDIEEAVEEANGGPFVFFCAINRGIIIDELEAIHNLQGKFNTSSSILRMLASSSSPANFSYIGQAFGWRVNPTGDSRLFQASVNNKVGNFQMIALAVDARSLIEPDWQPTSVADMMAAPPTGSWCHAYGLHDDHNARLRSPLAGLVRDIILKLNDEAKHRPENCPIRANIEFLSTVVGQISWLNCLRAAEIAGGKSFSYREIWSLISLSILGPRLSNDSDEAGVIAYVDNMLSRLDGEMSSVERAILYTELASHRFSQSLFRGQFLSLASRGNFRVRIPPDFPISKGFLAIDPCLDRIFEKGGNSRNISEQVQEAMQEIALESLPSSRLLEDNYVKGSWSKFDTEVEKAILTALPDCAVESERRALVSWLGSYLERLVSFAYAITGCSEEIRYWQICFKKTLSKNSSLPTNLEQPLRNLLFPRYDPSKTSSRVYVNAFGARCIPLQRGDASLSVIALSSDPSQLQLALRLAADRLVLRIMSHNECIAETTLDLELLREAMVWHDVSPGQTNSTRFIEPRLERTRALSLERIPVQHRKIHAIANGKILDVDI